jgi:predicted metal-binding membrane protein
MSDVMLERALARDRWIVGGCLALVAAPAWLWLWRQSVDMTGNSMAASSMPDRDMGGAMMVSAAATGPYLLSAFVMWLLMMVAMMLPSAAPMILVYGRLARGARAQGAALAPTAIFASVYLATWAAFSIAAALAQLLLIRTGFVSEMTLAFGSRRIAGALLVAAGLYQLTPLKRACLESCRSPMSFLMRLWRPSWTGAARLGLAHGLYCMGCCALLMALLFVFGVMNLAWVAALSLFVLIEKALPFGNRIGTYAGMVAVCVGAAIMIY